MSCKNQNSNGYWCKHKPSNCSCHKEKEVVYYQCKGSKGGSKKCNKYICKTNELIEVLEEKVDRLEDELNTAQENQVLAAEDLNNNIKPELQAIARALEGLRRGLETAENALQDVIDDINDEENPYLVRAQDAVDDALITQREIDEIIECLEHAFKGTVKCLKESGSGSCPILVPEPVCDHDDEDDCECRRPWEDEDDCDYTW